MLAAETCFVTLLANQVSAHDSNRANKGIESLNRQIIYSKNQWLNEYLWEMCSELKMAFFQIKFANMNIPNLSLAGYQSILTFGRAWTGEHSTAAVLQ